MIPGVTVTAVDRTGRRWSAVSDAQGRYAFGGLPAGSYRIEFALDGFKQLNLDGVSFEGGTAVIQDAMMQVGAISESVTVTGVSPRIDVSSASRSSAGSAPIRLGGRFSGVTAA